MLDTPTRPYLYTSAIVHAVAGLTMFVMVDTDTEHPPAAGTAFRIAIGGYSLDAAVAIVTGTVVMSTPHIEGNPYDESAEVILSREPDNILANIEE